MGNPSNTPKPNTVSAVLFPVPQLPAGAREGEGGEGEEEEELDQAQLPKEIKEKVYLVGDDPVRKPSERILKRSLLSGIK